MELLKSKINALYFCLYLTERTMHFAFNKINIFLLLYKIPFIKKRMKNKYGIENPLEYYNDFLLNKEYGFSQRFVFGAFFGIILIILLTICVLTNKLLQLNLDFENYYLIILGVIAYIFSHLLVFKNKTYLDYFEKFEKWSLIRKRVNIFLSFIFIILVFLSLIGSLKI
tara:strand:- start:127 stop:633 length:507 start_codon:yes stop_codon:yes gene_type:complete